jgi:dTDP-4-dehydrorhamnose 3,5-epimerase
VTRLAATDLPLAGLKRVDRQRLGDERGFFARLFCAEELRDAGWRAAVAQINHTMTARKGAVRGLHFQRPPHAEMKLVSCIRGTVWDVGVDLRRGSPTFLRFPPTMIAPC